MKEAHSDLSGMWRQNEKIVLMNPESAQIPQRGRGGQFPHEKKTLH